ncbi:hypothetical protein [Methanobrevibacter sp. UBA417]|jgi:hypothetical protein|uniref:hypothetical protein n=1 Tax=Methanobrevibacter sp. UBA417 TaxID=1915487 RepID=UPI0039B84E3E
MNLINTESKSLKKNIKEALKASKHVKSQEGYSIINLNHDTAIPRDDKVDDHITQILNEILKNDLINNNFKKEDIEDNVLIMLGELSLFDKSELNSEEFDKKYNIEIDKFKDKIENIAEKEFDYYDFTFIIENLSIEQNFSIGNVEFFTVKSIDKEKEKINEDNFDFYKLKCTYAKTTTFGSKEYATIKAEFNIKIAINILKLFIDPKCYLNFNLQGFTNDLPSIKYISYAEIKNITSRSMNWPYNSIDTEIDSTFLKKNKQPLNFLSTIVKNEKRNNFENKLIHAIYWFGEAISTPVPKLGDFPENKRANSNDNFDFFSRYEQLLKLIISLETAFVIDEKDKSETISFKVADLIDKEDYKDKIKSFLKSMYITRSKIVHGGSGYISYDNLDDLIYYTKLALINLTLNYANELSYTKSH